MSLIGKSIGNYAIKAKLGEGGMGAVYLGEHPLIGKRVAVKVLLEELASKEDIVNRFFNEAKAVNDIGHQNIVDIVDFGKMKSDTGSDIVYFIMEFLDGESLAARLRRTGLSFKETMHVMIQCCSALTASHAKGIVHRDLKPENIYLCPRGNDKNFIKLLDFGIAKLTGDGAGSSKTRTGIVIGTPSYMSPEQCEGRGHIDARSDIYSLGVVMYELLTGRVPFPGDGFGEILVAHLTKIPDLPSSLNPDIRPEIEAIVLHAIEKDKNRRFQTMGEFQQAVENPEQHLAAFRQLPGMPQLGAGGGGGPQGTMMLGGDSPTIRGPSAMMPTVRPPTGQGPRPTTLSGAASEVSGEAPKSKAPVIVAVVAVLALAGGGGFMMLNKKGGDTKDAPQAAVVTPPTQKDDTPATPPKEEFVTITVTSDPSGAKVFRAGKIDPEGVTPHDIKVKKGEPAFDIQVKADGHTSQVKTITTDVTKEIIVTLAKVAPVVATTTTSSSSSSSSKKKDSSSSSSSSSVSSSSSSSSKKKKKEDSPDDMKLLTPKF